MTKNELTNLLREYVKKNLSPTKGERDFVSSIYEAFQNALGEGCLMVGSYARFTASRPLHDLDILFVDGEFDPSNLHPESILEDIENTIRNKFQNPTKYQTKISRQTHSATISFIENGEEIFGVDIVPGYTSSEKNEYGDDIYWVPEILRTSRRHRQNRYAELEKERENEVEWWIKSDPRGYIKSVTDLNSQNSDFRKAVKFIKRWKYNCKVKNNEFKLKSFHIEQVLFRYFLQNSAGDIFDGIFDFFCDIPDTISAAKIRDRADSEKFIDEYVDELTDSQREMIIAARDAFLIKLESIAESASIPELLEVDSRTRASTTEEYLFDSKIPVFLEKVNSFNIQGNVLPRDGGFRGKILDAIGLIEVDREIQFRIVGNTPNADLFKWKVKNDDNSKEPRGEITDHQTLRDPEHTLYNGKHFVECYAIKDGVCIGKSRQSVVLKSIYNG